MIQLPSGKFSLAKHHRAANWLKNIDNFTSHPNLEGKACPQNGTCRIYLFAFTREKVDGDVEGGNVVLRRKRNSQKVEGACFCSATVVRENKFG